MPFTDVIKSAPTRSTEREFANHPSLKPQAFMRLIVRASLPLGEGVVLDTFMGGGWTIAAAEACPPRTPFPPVCTQSRSRVTRCPKPS